MSSNTNPSRKRATGTITEKSQDRPEHTALTTLHTVEEQQVKQESFDIYNANIDNFDNIDSTKLPVVHALTTPFPQGTIKVQAATLRKLKDQVTKSKSSSNNNSRLKTLNLKLPSKKHAKKTYAATQAFLATHLHHPRENLPYMMISMLRFTYKRKNHNNKKNTFTLSLGCCDSCCCGSCA
jgi:hypothetical protein